MDGLSLFYVSFQNIHSVAQYKVIILSYFKKTVVKLYLTQVYNSILAFDDKVHLRAFV